MPTPSSIRPQPVRRDAQSPITSCGCSASTPAGTRRKREQRFRQRLGHGGRPRSAHQMPTTSTPTSRSRASCSPQDNGHYRDDALASRGRCGRRLLLGWTDPLGCGRQFLGPRRARSQGQKEQRFALCSLNPRCPAHGSEQRASPSIRSGGRCFRSQCVSARKRSQTCARTISSCFPSDRDPPADEALVRRRHAAARRLQARQSGRRAPPRRRPGRAHELPRLRRPRAALQRLRASLRLFTPRPRVVPGMSDDGRAVAPPSPILTPSSLRLGDDTQASGRAPARRLPATTSRRVCRAFSSSTVRGRRACRGSRGPCGDVGKNPCRRQGDVVVAASSDRSREQGADSASASVRRLLLGAAPPGLWRVQATTGAARQSGRVGAAR